MEYLFTGVELTEEAKATLTAKIQAEIDKRVEGAKNDPEFVDSIRNQEAGKFFATMEKTLKKNLDIKPDDIDKDLSGLKKLEAMLKGGISSFEKNKDKTNQDLQAELLAVTAKKQEIEDSIPELIKKTNEKHYEKYISDGIFQDSVDIECVVGPKAKVPLVNAFLNDKGLKRVWNEDDSTYDFVTKDNLKYTVGGKALNKREIIELALQDVLKKSNGTPPPGGNPPGTPPGPNGKAEHSDEARKMAASFGMTI